MLQQLPEHVQDALMPAMQYRRVAPGDVIVRQGEPVRQQRFGPQPAGRFALKTSESESGLS